jgi:hypothetical protein
VVSFLRLLHHTPVCICLVSHTCPCVLYQQHTSLQSAPQCRCLLRWRRERNRCHSSCLNSLSWRLQCQPATNLAWESHRNLPAGEDPCCCCQLSQVNRVVAPPLPEQRRSLGPSLGMRAEYMRGVCHVAAVPFACASRIKSNPYIRTN